MAISLHHFTLNCNRLIRNRFRHITTWLLSFSINLCTRILSRAHHTANTFRYHRYQYDPKWFWWSSQNILINSKAIFMRPHFTFNLMKGKWENGAQAHLRKSFCCHGFFFIRFLCQSIIVFLSHFGQAETWPKCVT